MTNATLGLCCHISRSFCMISVNILGNTEAFGGCLSSDGFYKRVSKGYFVDVTNSN